MNAMGFAWRSLVRQPARAVLAVLGVAAIGALLFDMLMLSQGLIVSMRDLLERSGWDVRVTSTAEAPGVAPPIADAAAALRTVEALPEIQSALTLRSVDMRLQHRGRTDIAALLGVSRGAATPWTVTSGRDVRAPGEVVVNERMATRMRVEVGQELRIQAFCQPGWESLPSVIIRVVGVADFPLARRWDLTAAGTIESLERACGGTGTGQADVILATSTGDAATAARAIQGALPDLYARSNEELLGRMQQNGFTYFRQISTVLTTVTVSFALLLITVLLTVSVNQRLGEIAALRALGFTRARVVADVLSESALIVGGGGLLSLPFGLVLARGLDFILTRMPGIPADLHFFVFERRALMVHLVLLAVTSLVAALYPMRIVARLPIAATLRSEVIG